MTNDWHQLLASNHQVGAVFFYIRKAFDSVPHNQILLSLAKIGVPGSLLSWFNNYLSGRYQRVVLEGVSSPLSQVTSGVPQGSILGPLLFIIFMDSISKSPFSPNAKLALFADDVVLYKPINSEQDILALQDDINHISEWCRDNGLILKSEKTALLPITCSPKPIPLHLKVNNYPTSAVVLLSVQTYPGLATFIISLEPLSTN